MDSLAIYAAHFNAAYPDYADRRYTTIQRLIEAYDQPDVLDLIEGDGTCDFSS